MTKVFAGIVMAALLSSAASVNRQNPGWALKSPMFTLVHRSEIRRCPECWNLSYLEPASRAERYEVRNATMVDLIRTAYGVDPERVVGGPTWLEFDRFDITALVRPSTPPET